MEFKATLPHLLFFLAIISGTFYSLNCAAQFSYQPPQTAVPGDLELSLRRQMIVKRWVDDWAVAYLSNDDNWGFGNFRKDCGVRSFRRLAAVLTAMRDYEELASYLEDRVNLARGKIIWLANRWITEKADKRRHNPLWYAGSGDNGDYDMCLKEQVAFLYEFTEDSNLLSHSAALQILENLTYRGQNTTTKMKFQIGPLEYPETENHVLMIYSSKYLTNQWIQENPRNLSTVAQIYSASPDSFNNAEGPLEKHILALAGRIVYNGFFETNARQYQTFSFHSLLNLYNSARSSKVRAAALNALDYASIKFAFQSFASRRYGPYRRNCKYATHYGIARNDGMTMMMGILSGSYPWPDGPHSTEDNKNLFYKFTNSPGHALWAALGSYSLHPAVHDFMNHKRAGYWARMQARYTEKHYEINRASKYFNSNGSIWMQGEMQAAPELYFVTEDFMNTAGGKYNRYPIEGDVATAYHSCESSRGARVYDFLARPQTVMLKNHYDSWSTYDDLADDLLTMPGYTKVGDSDSVMRPYFSPNHATYKSFSYGFAKSGDQDSTCDFSGNYHNKLPLEIPSSWEKYARWPEDSDEWVMINEQAKFAVYDLREDHNIYAIIAQVGKRTRNIQYRCFKRGFWEIVPGHRSQSAEELATRVVELNPSDHFPSDPTKDYQYKMTTGETIGLNAGHGYSDGNCRPPFTGIWDENGEAQNLNTLVANTCAGQDAIRSFPLIEVKEVDRDFKFTGRIFAHSRGNGVIFVHNPFVKTALIINSHDYLNPTRLSYSTR